MADNSILRRFERTPLSAAALAQIETNTATFRSFAETLLTNTPPGRELSSALTALEEAKFWTNQAVALNGAAPTDDTTPTEGTPTDD